MFKLVENYAIHNKKSTFRLTCVFLVVEILSCIPGQCALSTI